MIHQIRRMSAVFACVLMLSSAMKAAEKENPYPYGKAEFQAKTMDSVVELVRISDQYRGECVRRSAEHRPMAEIEHYGREAKNWYRAVLEREPSNAYACLAIGYMDLILGRAAPDKAAQQNYYSSAISRFREALDKRPGYAEALLYMAQVQALRGEYPEAEKNLALILNSGIENSHIHAWMAYVLTQTKRPAEARKHIASAIELDDPSRAAQWSRENQGTIESMK